MAATKLEHLNYWLGIPVVVITALVGTSVFVDLQRRADSRWQIFPSSRQGKCPYLKSFQYSRVGLDLLLSLVL